MDSCRCDYRKYKLGRRKTGLTGCYISWQAMMNRCYSTRCENYSNYGGRGVTVCQRWHDFDNFFEDMGHRPVGCSLDKDIKGGKGCDEYSPSNCCWATKEEQSNHKRNNLELEVDGLTLTLAQWSKKLGLDKGLISRQLKRGLSMKDIANGIRKYDRNQIGLLGGTPPGRSGEPNIWITQSHRFKLVIRRDGIQVNKTFETLQEAIQVRDEVLGRPACAGSLAQ